MSFPPQQSCIHMVSTTSSTKGLLHQIQVIFYSRSNINNYNVTRCSYINVTVTIEIVSICSRRSICVGKEVIQVHMIVNRITLNEDSGQVCFENLLCLMSNISICKVALNAIYVTDNHIMTFGTLSCSRIIILLILKKYYDNN